MFEGVLRGLIFWGFILATLVPFTSITVKRLHDFNASGYWAIGLIPASIFGGIWIILLVLILIGLIPATLGTNRFGDDARGGNMSVFD